MISPIMQGGKKSHLEAERYIKVIKWRKDKEYKKTHSPSSKYKCFKLEKETEFRTLYVN